MGSEKKFCEIIYRNFFLFVLIQIVHAQRTGGDHHICAESFCTVCNLFTHILGHFFLFQRNISTAAFISVWIDYRFSSDGTDKIFHDLWILRIIELKHFAWAKKKTSVICAYFLSGKWIYYFLLKLIKSNLVS